MYDHYQSFPISLHTISFFCHSLVDRSTSFSGYSRSKSFMTGRKSAKAFFWMLPDMNWSKTHIRWSLPLMRPLPASWTGQEELERNPQGRDFTFQPWFFFCFFFYLLLALLKLPSDAATAPCAGSWRTGRARRR